MQADAQQTKISTNEKAQSKLQMSVLQTSESASMQRTQQMNQNHAAAAAMKQGFMQNLPKGMQKGQTQPPNLGFK